jgi:regulator of sigma E protease
MAIASSISMHSAAEAAGVEVGDVISAVDGDPIFSFGQLVEKVQGAGGAAVKLDVWRAGEMIEFELTPRVTTEQLADGSFVTNMRIGIAGQMFFDPETEHVGFGAGASAAIERVWDIITGSLRGLWAMLTGAISACNLSGPIGIAQASGAMASQGALSFIGFVALLSTAVGLLNLFPIPVLDGGHLVFHAYEAVRGKPPSDLALRILMTIGLGLILTLMIVGTGSDIICRLLA